LSSGNDEAAREEGMMKTRSLLPLVMPLFVFELLIGASALLAKPKVEVRIRAHEGTATNPAPDSLSKYNSPVAGSLPANEVFYFNVTVFSDNAEAVAKNNGQWCIKGYAQLSSFDYQGTLDGNDLEVEIPQKDGKKKKMTFKIIDRKWRNLSDF
jgi:hypothetical protein